MSQNVPASFQVKFLNNVEMALQLQSCPLLGSIDEQDDAGAEKVKVKDIVGNTAAKEADTRHGRTEWGDRTYDGVWLPKPPELYDADLIDDADRLATSIDLDGTATTGAAGTIARARTQRILEGFYGPIISGKTGTVVTPFPGTNIIPVTEGGASGAQKMNVKKLRGANKLLGENYVDKELKKFMILTEDDNDALLSEVPATSADFKGSFGGVVEDGYLKKLLGWNFIHLELDNPLLKSIPELATDGSGYRKTPFWVKPGVRLNWWKRLRTKVGEIPEMRFNTGYYAGTTLASTRTQAGMSGIILNEKG